jgi:hypothetical protein
MCSFANTGGAGALQPAVIVSRPLTRPPSRKNRSNWPAQPHDGVCSFDGGRALYCLVQLVHQRAHAITADIDQPPRPTGNRAHNMSPSASGGWSRSVSQVELHMSSP